MEIKELFGLNMKQWQTVYEKYPEYFVSTQGLLDAKWEYKLNKRYTIAEAKKVSKGVKLALNNIIENG